MIPVTYTQMRSRWEHHKAQIRHSEDILILKYREPSVKLLRADKAKPDLGEQKEVTFTQFHHNFWQLSRAVQNKELACVWVMEKWGNRKKAIAMLPVGIVIGLER